ncbi:hypothetical protein DFH06DRAFT_190486 [Mycena polygramma]|nr:hypothetical protein DFH06DRAFT_190486 [Mycena polygramma]
MDQKVHMEEILDLIFDCLDEHPGLHRGLSIFGLEPGKTWAALARTCRTFKNPALNALWRAQRSLVPALSCFPDDLWNRTTDSKSFLGFRRPLTLADWERPTLYWARIRSFQIDSFDTTQISRDVCEMFRLCCPSQNLFPNLQAIEWLDPNPASFPVIAMLLSPRLRSVQLDPTRFATHSSLLSTLSVNHPDLAAVDLQGKYRIYCDPGIIRSIAAFLSNLNRLESLRISNVDAAILQHVSGLPSLKTLDINELMSLESVPRGNGVDPPFPCLEELSLWATTPDVGVAMVGAVAHRRLNTLNLIFEAEYPTSQTTARLHAAIAANSSYDTLICLRVEDNWSETRSRVDVPDELGFDHFVVGRESLQILFAFTNLRTVILKPCYGFHLDVNDRVVSEMARAWCRVEELRLARSHDLHTFGFGAAITLQGIRAIATHCKNLHTLEINFNATRIPLPSDACVQTSLATLEVHCSRIVSPTAVALFLSEIFPNLNNVHSFCLLDRPRSAVGRWETVQRLVTGSTFRGRSEGFTDEEFTDTDDAYSASESD